MMPLSHREHQNAALQYRWFSAGSGIARLKATEHAGKRPVTSAGAAHCHQSESSDTMPKGAGHTAKAQARTRQTTAAYLQSP